ncbi:hypothetical protein, partial [Chelonobacter oris]|uniref:hypothetical protein n=1 Tax=Chelonobacter oris TaxID=505317 RepID=UPI00244CBD19
YLHKLACDTPEFIETYKETVCEQGRNRKCGKSVKRQQRQSGKPNIHRRTKTLTPWTMAWIIALFACLSAVMAFRR